MGFSESYAMHFEKYMRDKPIVYLVYYNKGEIKCKMGKIYASGTFHEIKDGKADRTKWHTGVPITFMECSSKNRVLCRDPLEIPKAIKLIKENIAKRVKLYSVSSNNTIKNMQKFLDDENRINKLISEIVYLLEENLKMISKLEVILG